MTEKGNRIRGNVCLEVYLPSRGTCLLQHINLGACQIGDISKAFVDGMSELCSLHAVTGVGESGEYLPSQTDRQVGLGMLGLANLLRRYDVTYEQFGAALHDVNHGEVSDTNAHNIAVALEEGVNRAAEVAKGLIWCGHLPSLLRPPVAIGAQIRYGFTCTPEIAPPIARKIDRDSGTFGVQSYFYGDVEIASECGWDAYKAVPMAS